MSLFSETTSVPEFYIICIMNSRLIAKYVDSFINSTSHCTTGDAKLIFVKVPTNMELKEFKTIFDRAYSIKKQQLSLSLSNDIAESVLSDIQMKLDSLVDVLYGI